MIQISKQQARQFLVAHQNLSGDRLPNSKSSIMKFIGKVGSIQFDPVNICGKNANIVLHARIENYSPQHLDDLLYADRKLVDFYDKCLCILPTRDLPAIRKGNLGSDHSKHIDDRAGKRISQMKTAARKIIRANGFVSSKDLNGQAKMTSDWGFSASLATAALESMYFGGELVIHHKSGMNKCYAFTKDHIPAEIFDSPLPFKNEKQRIEWWVMRRIGSQGMLWNNAGDVWIGMRMLAKTRAEAIERLIRKKELFEVSVEDIASPFFIRSKDRENFEGAIGGDDYETRMEFIAPLDNLMWDRKMIEAIFDFKYKWEIYNKPADRKFGPYTLPILQGDSLIGRTDLARKAGKVIINNVWTESGKKFDKPTQELFDETLSRFEQFNFTGVSPKT